MNELALVQKVWNYAHVLRDQGVVYQTYISQIASEYQEEQFSLRS